GLGLQELEHPRQNEDLTPWERERVDLLGLDDVELVPDALAAHMREKGLRDGRHVLAPYGMVAPATRDAVGDLTAELHLVLVGHPGDLETELVGVPDHVGPCLEHRTEIHPLLRLAQESENAPAHEHHQDQKQPPSPRHAWPPTGTAGAARGIVYRPTRPRGA